MLVNIEIDGWGSCAIQESDFRIPMNPDDSQCQICHESDDDTVQNHFRRRLDLFDRDYTLHEIFENETGQYNNEEVYTEWRLANCVTLTCGPSTQPTSNEEIDILYPCYNKR